ncbi:MAG TPA: SMP-30/gluconolactonase/LRE family protein [Paraburkholderia sp.]|nr:SMP-30/gluconolactonase/LRE family protein [Paraburkholderia sp.]
MTSASAGIEASLVLDARCTLGESATWCSRTGRLYWVDITGARLWRYDPSDGSHEIWPMPERLATFALCDDARHLLLGFASKLAFIDLETGLVEPVVDVEPDLDTRVNDGRCDRQGRFVFGTKDEGFPRRAVGGFYRLNRDLSLERLPLPAPAISNSIAFSPDGTTMYYCDSPTRQIRACDYGADGRIANDRPFVALADTDGVPDGSTVDADGGLWNAQWGGACVVRYDASGRETERVTVPTAQPSCVTLGGAQLTTLYITSAYEELTPDAHAADPHAGGVFAAPVGRRGLPEPRFGGVPRGFGATRGAQGYSVD